MENEYKIMSVSELKLLLKNESKEWTDFDWQHPYSKAFVYYMKNGDVIMLPNNLAIESAGIWFESKNVYKKFDSIGKFPIENEMKSIEEEYQNLFKDFPKSLKSASDYFNSKYSVDTITLSLSEVLVRLQQDVRFNMRFSLEDMYSVLLLGEFIRREFGGRWILLECFGTFNSYYTLGLIDSNNKILFPFEIYDLYFCKSEIALTNFMKTPFVRNWYMTLQDQRFSARFSSFRIIERNVFD